MSNTTTPDVYVMCENFCGLRISKLADHAPECGAPDEERARIETELKAKRIAAAASSEPANDDETLDDETLDEGEIGDDERIARDVEVDAQRARFRAGSSAQPEEPALGADVLAMLWTDPVVHAEWVTLLQEKIDAGGITIGGAAAGKACRAKKTVDYKGSAVEIACPHKPIIRSVETHECNLEHKHTETLDQVCLIHAVVAWGGERPLAGAGPLFGADDE